MDFDGLYKNFLKILNSRDDTTELYYQIAKFQCKLVTSIPIENIENLVDEIIELFDTALITDISNQKRLIDFFER